MDIFKSEKDVRKFDAWAKAKPAGLSGLLIAGSSDESRIDDHGNLILWSQYGRHDLPYGWEIDHRHPSALGGSDHRDNLRALHCRANRSLGGILGSLLNPGK